MRGALVLALLATATLAGPAIASPLPVRTDRLHGVRFNLKGDDLTVRLVPQARPGLRMRVWGRRVQAICSTTFKRPRGSRAYVAAVRLWPRGRSRLEFSFDRDISNRVKWCLLEGAGGRDIAAADFAVSIDLYGTSESDTRIARGFRRYLLRAATGQPWLHRVSAIAVNRGVIVVATQLRRTRGARRIARHICRLIRTADIAGVTGGHSVLGQDLGVLRSCRGRAHSA
jgi:hypothetical protein